VAYLIDSNVLIQAKNGPYGFDFHPGFWEWLIDANTNGVLYSVAKVAEELRDGGDELADWVRDRDDSFFLAPDDRVVASLHACSQWVNGCGQYEPAAIATFLDDSADYYLVAHAHAHDHIVVTHERAENSRLRVKIPNACAGMNVDCVNPFQMLSAVGVQFVVGR
jgi:Domain of unknown function (DUF4411)